MKRLVFLIILAGCAPNIVSGDHEKTDINVSNNAEVEEMIDTVLVWDKFRKLSWKDFNGKVDSLSEHHAMTFIHIPFQKFIVYDDSIVFDLPCLFVRSQSWVLDRSDILLKHEQKHFDIGEIIARRMRKELSNYVSSDNAETTLFLQALVNKYYLEENKYLNDTYDFETDHGKEKSAQERWNKKIDEMLDELKDYGAIHIVLPRSTKETPKK